MRILVPMLFVLALTATVAVAHDGEDGHFDTGELSRGFSATHDFLEPGKVPFACLYHPDTMRGTFVITEEPADGAGILLELQDARIVFADEPHTDLRLSLPLGATVEVVNRDQAKHRLVQEDPAVEDSPALGAVSIVAAVAVAALVSRLARRA